MSNQLYLAMSYTHDKLANDVDCIAEVSTDLVNWSSGPAYSQMEAVLDLGARERITVRGLLPVASATHHFMRLRFHQRPG